MALLVLICAGCGAEGGSTSVFKTATVTYSVAPINANLTYQITSPITLPTSGDATDVTLTVTNTPFSTDISPSAFTVKNMIVTYTKTDNSAINFSVFGADTPLASGAPAAIPIELATLTVQDDLIGSGFISGTTTWSFYVTASFTVLEDNSNTAKSYNVQLGQVTFY